MTHQLRILRTGHGLVECPRWYDGCLWFADWGAGEIIRVTPDGASEVVARAAAPPLSFDFLPDGRMIVVAARERHLLRREADGALVTHADLSALPATTWNEIVVDGRGNIYVNGGGLDPPRGNTPPGIIALVMPDGTVRQVAEGFAFPNGMAVSADNATLVIAESWARRLTAFEIAPDGNLERRRGWAELGNGTPDGICFDRDGACWYADVPNRRCQRVRDGGEVIDEIVLDRGAFACMLGGDDRRTLYITAAKWFGMDRMAEMQGTGQLLAVDVPIAAAGWP